MLRLVKTLPTLLLAASFAALGCHAQVPDPGTPLSPDIARRVEVLLRQKASLPPGSTIQVGTRHKSDFAGYDSIAVTFTSIEGSVSRPINFLISADNKQVVQMTKFDISADPRDLVSGAGRPARGGPPSAPVLIVGFDDMECPYCAQLNANIFPAITDRYKDQVRIVYRDYPIEQHPWAMRAAVDINCLAAESPVGYWNVVDYIHAHAGDIGTAPPAKDSKPGDAPAPEKTLDIANSQLDNMVREQATVQKVDSAQLNACINKQDKAAIVASQKLGESLGVDSTPTLFINGDKFDGALPIGFFFKMIDQALIAEGKTPPPPYVGLKPVEPKPTTPPTPTPASK